MMTDEMDTGEIFGVPIPDLPKGQMAVDAFVLVKAMDTQSGDISHWELRSKGLNHHEAMAMALSASDTLRDFLLHGHGCCDEGH